jgi:hypothetical protein
MIPSKRGANAADGAAEGGAVADPGPKRVSNDAGPSDEATRGGGGTTGCERSDATE